MVTVSIEALQKAITVVLGKAGSVYERTDILNPFPSMVYCSPNSINMDYPINARSILLDGHSGFICHPLGLLHGVP